MPSNSAFEFPITQGFGPTKEKRDGAYKGYANFNKGYDFGAPVGTSVPSTQAGTVISAGDSKDGWGLSVKVRDPNGFVHNYGHLSGISVRPGDQIERGQVIGATGNTGVSSGPHLSYDVYRADTGEFVDPAPWVGGGGNGPMVMPQSTPQQGGSDPLLVAIQAAIRAMQSGDPNTIADASEALQTLTNAWKVLNPNSPLDIALKQYELETLARNQQRTDIREDRRDDMAQWRDQNTLAQNDFQNQRTYQADTIAGPKGAFDTRSQWVKDQNDIADANYTNQLNYFDREALQDTQQLNYAAADIKRALDAKDEARQRATQIDKTLMDAAGWALPPGTEYYPGREPTSLFAQAARGAGMTWDDNLYRVPDGMTNDTASIRINPNERLRQQDSEMGVAGPVPNVPEFVRRTPPSVPTPLSAPDPSNLISTYENLQPVKPPSFSMDNYPTRPEVPSMPTPPDIAALDREQRERFTPPPSIYNTAGLQVTPPPRDIRGDYAPVEQPQASASTGGGVDPTPYALLALLGVGGLGGLLGYNAFKGWKGMGSPTPSTSGATGVADDVLRRFNISSDMIPKTPKSAVEAGLNLLPAGPRTAISQGMNLLPPGTSVPQIPAISSWQLPNAIPMPPSRQQAGESLVEFLKRMGKAASRVK